MSHNPSPGPSLASQQRPKPKVALGITAGAEDVKYHAKYKELKKKVKEIEGDNDRLHFKVLQAKRNIQRMKLERAILYERLSTVPHSPSHQQLIHGQTSDVPPASLPQHREPRERPELDPPYTEYMLAHGPRVVAHDNRPLPPVDAPVAPRRTSGNERHDVRHLPPLPPLPSMEVARHSPGEHRRSHSSSRTHQPPQMPFPPAPQYPEGLPPQFHHSPSDRDRTRVVDLTQHDVHHTPLGPLSPRPRSSDSRASSRIHNHQRLGPGMYLNREDERDRELEREREYEWQRERERVRGRGEISSTPMHSPPYVHRPRQEYQEHLPTSRMRDEPGYYHDVPGPGAGGGTRGAEYSRLSRSGTPGSGSGGSGSAIMEGPSRPDSRGPYFEPEHSRSYRLRPVEELEYIQDDSRSQSRDRGGAGFAPPQSETRSTVETRKRHRHDIEVDEPEPSVYSSHLTDDRGSKRYHRDHLHRDVDEDDRMRP